MNEGPKQIRFPVRNRKDDCLAGIIIQAETLVQRKNIIDDPPFRHRSLEKSMITVFCAIQQFFFFRINFQSLLKREWINRFKIRDYQQANRLVFEYIEAFYNTKRIHGYCGYMSPNDFEALYEKTKDSRLQLAG